MAARTTAVVAAAIVLVGCFRSVEPIRLLPPDHQFDGVVRAAAAEDYPFEGGTTQPSPSRSLGTLPTPHDHLVKSLPLLDGSSFPTKHYAGLLPLSRTDDDKHMFYWLFEPDFSSAPGMDADEPSEVPLLIWLNGGPGCSSMMGLWLENGPFRLHRNSEDGRSDDWTVRINPHSWHNAPAWLLFIDQPVGTGFSFTKRGNYCGTDELVDADFYAFLETFLLVYKRFFLKEMEAEEGPQGGGAGRRRAAGGSSRLTLNRRLYFSGESHAGHYIPSMVDFILARNDDVDSPPQIHMPIAGAAIGNGWTDPYHQYAAADIGYHFGFIDLAQKAALDRIEMTCRESIVYWLKDKSNHTKHCFSLTGLPKKGSGGANGYDARSFAGEYPPGHTIAEKYLNGEIDGMSLRELYEALHLWESSVDVGKYKQCKNAPYSALFHQDALGVVDELVRVLDHPTRPRILLYYGMDDFICNHVGGERMMNNLPWSRRPSWTVAERYSWDGPKVGVGGADADGGSADFKGPAGYLKEHENLMFLKLPNCGHMVPMDQPEIALDMMKTFMGDGCFRSHCQRMGRGFPREMNLLNVCEICPSCSNISLGSKWISNGANCAQSNESEVGGKGGETSTLVEGSQPVAWLAGAVGAIFTFLVVASIYALVCTDARKAGATIIPGNDNFDDNIGSGPELNAGVSLGNGIT